jgi:hypothetical protein
MDQSLQLALEVSRGVNVLVWLRDIWEREVQVCPEGGTYWRGSWGLVSWWFMCVWLDGLVCVASLSWEGGACFASEVEGKERLG